MDNSFNHYCGAELRGWRIQIPHDAWWEVPLEVIQEVTPQVQPRNWLKKAHWNLLIFSSKSQKYWQWHDIAFSCKQFSPSWTNNSSCNIPKTFQVLLSSVLLIVKIDSCTRLQEGQFSINNFKQSNLIFLCVVGHWPLSGSTVDGHFWYYQFCLNLSKQRGYWKSSIQPRMEWNLTCLYFKKRIFMILTQKINFLCWNQRF